MDIGITIFLFIIVQVISVDALEWLSKHPKNKEFEQYNPKALNPNKGFKPEKY